MVQPVFSALEYVQYRYLHLKTASTSALQHYMGLMDNASVVEFIERPENSIARVWAAKISPC